MPLRRVPRRNEQHVAAVFSGLGMWPTLHTILSCFCRDDDLQSGTVHVCIDIFLVLTNHIHSAAASHLMLFSYIWHQIH